MKNPRFDNNEMAALADIRELLYLQTLQMVRELPDSGSVHPVARQFEDFMARHSEDNDGV